MYQRPRRRVTSLWKPSEDLISSFCGTYLMIPCVLETSENHFENWWLEEDYKTKIAMHQ